MSEKTKYAMFKCEQRRLELFNNSKFSNEAKDYLRFIDWQEDKFAFYHCKNYFYFQVNLN